MKNIINNPLVTIGITYFNGGDYIESCINSAINQTYKNIEIIIIDDKSNKKNKNIINNLQKKFNNISVFTNFKNKGVGYSRNKIIKKSNGEYIAFFDQDDLSIPGRIKIQLNTIQRLEKKIKNNKILCYSSRVLKNSNNKIIKTIGNKSDIFISNSIKPESFLVGNYLNGHFGSLATCSLMAPKAAFIKNKYFDQSLRRHEDTEFNIRASIKNYFFIGLREALVIQTKTKNEYKSNLNEYHNHLNLLKKHARLIKNNQDFEFYRDLLYVKYFKNFKSIELIILNLLKNFDLIIIKTYFIIKNRI
jgi:glycosyltransferase involved in cell wall biosynthesis